MNPYQPMPTAADSLSNQDVVNQQPKVARSIAGAIGISLLVLASGPLLWLGILMLIGAMTGDSMHIFTNRLYWEDEFVGKIPAALMISSVGAMLTFFSILTERSTQPSKNDGDGQD
jgi:hypothetical protein